MQIMFPIININQPQNRQPSFNGYTKKLSKEMLIDGKKDILKLIEEKNAIRVRNTNVGKMPPIIFNAIKALDNKSEKIKEIFTTFGEVSAEIREFRPTLDKQPDERLQRRSNESVEKMRQLFLGLGLINEDTKFDLKFLGEGNYKKAYKIEGVTDPESGEELCFKVFHVADKSKEWHKFKTHGNCAELNTSIYWMNTFGYNTQRGKFYFGDIDNGFFVDKFIDKKVEMPQKYVDETEVGVKLTDEVAGDVGHNKLHGYSIDPGGPRVVNRVKNRSKLARKIFDDIKEVPKDQRISEWYRLMHQKDNLNPSHKHAGLAIAIKHLPHRSAAFEECLAFDDQFVDMGLAYVLKYQKLHNAKKYFKLLMQRKDPITQTVLMNEIPLIAREKIKVDDLDVPKGQINQQRLYEYYKIAQEYALPEVEQHLCSYIHLLPEDKMIPEAEKLINKDIYENIDRMLHKIKFVKDEEFSYGNKMAILSRLEERALSNNTLKKADGSLANAEEIAFIKQKIRDVRIYVIRNQLDD